MMTVAKMSPRIIAFANDAARTQPREVLQVFLSLLSGRVELADADLNYLLHVAIQSGARRAARERDVVLARHNRDLSLTGGTGSLG